jgi:DNA primase
MTGRIPQSFINDLLNRVDIVDVIDARLQLRKAGRDYQALCPFHNEKTPSFTVSPEKQFYHCFGCGESGTALTFLMEHDRMEFVEAVEALAQLVGVEVPREQGGRPARDNTDLYDVLAAADRYFRKALRQSPEAIEYLKARGVTGTIARDFGIGYAPDEWQGVASALAGMGEAKLLEAGLLTRGEKGRAYDRFRGRIMFPIRDTRGRIIGFGGRVMADGGGPKYLNSPETPVFHKGRELYGLYEARQALRRIDRLLVVEGYMDVVALAQAGISNAVASLGTAATEEHFQSLYRYTGEVVCCFDGDAAGRQAAWRALESALPALSDGRGLKFMFLPEGEDPDSLVRARGKAGFLELAARAVPAVEYLFGRLEEGLDLGSVDDKARFASLAMPHIDRLPAGILKELMASRLEGLTGFRPNAQARPSKAPARRAAADVSLTPLARRLVGYLLRDPSVVSALSEEARRALRPLAGNDLLAELVTYLDDHPDAETPELLGRWTGHDLHDELTGLARQPSAIDVAAVRGDFTEGVVRYLEKQQASARRQLISEMHQDPSAERLKDYWSLKQGPRGKVSGTD